MKRDLNTVLTKQTKARRTAQKTDHDRDHDHDKNIPVFDAEIIDTQGKRRALREFGFLPKQPPRH